MNPIVLIIALCAALCAAMIGCSLHGHAVGRRRTARGIKPSEGYGAITGAIFGLFGLLLAFSFSGAYSRYEVRRSLMADEINDIGTAYLRVDLMPAAAQPPMRALFREYVASRAAVYRKLIDIPAAEAEMRNSARIQQEIWNAALAGTREPDGADAKRMLLPALNSMIDITTTIEVAMRSHPHPLIFGVLFGLALVCAWLVGHGMADHERANRVYVVGFAVVMSLMLYVILDVEFPRLGIVRLDWMNEMLMRSGEAMK